MFRRIVLILGVLFNLFAFAKKSNNKEMLQSQLASSEVENPLINEVVKIKPIANHHFNLEAPQNCGTQGTINSTAREVSCQFHASGEQKALVSVCDNDKKYCKQQNLSFKVQEKTSQTPRIQVEMREETKQAQEKAKKMLMPGFQNLSPNEAKASKEARNGILVLVSAEWCPPCNLVKEFLIPSKEYQSATQDFLKIYVDGDSPLMEPWRAIVGSPGYPSHFLLDANLNIVDIKSDYVKAFEFSRWIKKSKNWINDPIKKVQARIEARISKNFVQKVKDIFLSEEQLQLDSQRLLNYLESRFQLKELAKYLEKLKPKNYKYRLLRARYLNAYMRDGSLIKDFKQTKKEFMDQTAQELLASPIGKDHWIYESLVSSQCSLPSKDNQKTSTSSQLTPKLCKTLISDYVSFKKNQLEKKQNDLLPQEKLYDLASLLFMQARMKDLLKQKERSEVFYSNCFKTYDQMAEFSPLKKQSRATRIYSLYCRNRMEKAPSLKTLLSLVRDYPMESTFYIPLARLYLKKKQIKNADEAIDKALKFSYGDNWIHANIMKARILKASKKVSEARKVLLSSLQEIQTAVDNRRTLKWLARVRSELKTLK